MRLSLVPPVFTMLRCCTCLRDTEPHDALPLFNSEPAETPSPADLLAEITQLTISVKNNFPENICKDCHEQLRISRAFIKKVRETYHTLCENSTQISLNGNLDSSPEKDKATNVEKLKTRISNESETNCLDLCDEIGITIENQLENEDPVQTNNFQGDISIVYSDKAIQVDFGCEHHTNDSNNVICLSGSIENLSENSHCDKNCSDKLDETDIKQEPEEYINGDYDLQSYSSNLMDDGSMSTIQIKIEPLSEDAALRFHQAALSRNDDKVNHLDESDVEMSFNISNNSDSLFIEDDIKPTQEELDAYAENIRSNNAEDDSESTSSQSQMDIIEDGSLNETNSQSEMCMLCNKDFKTKSILKQHVILQHSYYESIKCDQCGLNFMNSNELNNHVVFHGPDEFEFFCPLCNRDFINDTYFKTHLGDHKEIVLLKRGDKETTLCSRCNNSFNNLTELFNHIRNFCEFSTLENNQGGNSHTENIDFCEQQVGSDNQEGEINEAERFVTNKIMNNCCPHCSEKCENIHMLKIHLKRHDSFRKILERSFVCTLCMFKFKRKDHLIRHLINVHRVSSESRRKKLMLML